MKIGKYDVNLIDAGRFGLDGGAMFGVVPRNLWARKKPADEQNRIYMSTNLLLVRGEGRTILIDTGLPTTMSEKLASIYGIDFSDHNLINSLARFDLTTEDITDVIFTHLHFDHAGGASSRTEDGILVPTFANATHYVQKRHFEWAIQPSEKDRASFIADNFMPVHEAGKLTQLESGCELFPGIDVIPVEGHTIGQQMVLIDGGDGPGLLYAADLLPTSAHVPVPWVMAYDLYPVTTVEEKKQYLAMAVSRGWMVFFEHDPEVHCAKIEQTERGYTLGELVDLRE